MRRWNKVGADQNFDGLRDVTTPLEGRFAIRELQPAIVNIRTEFEVSISTYYEIMKGNTKCRKWGGFGCLGLLKVTRNNTNR